MFERKSFAWMELEENFLWKSEHPKLCHAACFMILYIEEF